MRFIRILTLISVVSLVIALAFAGQVQAASDGCNAINSRLPSSDTIAANGGVSGGTIALGTNTFDAGEVITVSMDSGLSGGVALQDGSSGTLASTLLPNSASYTIPTTGTYTFAAYFDVSNQTASDLPGLPTVTCAGIGTTDNRTVSLPNGAIYVNADVISVAGITNQGEGAFISISAAELAELPTDVEENTLLASSGDGFVSLYRLTTGELQINIGPDLAGNVSVIIFDGLPPSRIYRRDFNVNDILYPPVTETPAATAEATAAP